MRRGVPLELCALVFCTASVFLCAVFRSFCRSTVGIAGLFACGIGRAKCHLWRAYKLKTLIDADFRAHPQAYPRIGKKPDPNIDFRRVPNMTAFFKRHALVLPTGFTPDAPASLEQRQGGDLVIFANPDHIAIVSDKRNGQGVLLLLHNDEPWPAKGMTS